MPAVLRVALTGGIATGKSHCLARFADLGAPTIDADVLARQAIAAGTSGFDAVVRRFGSTVVGPDGEIDRAALGPLVFADPVARHDLEAIVHPVVYAAVQRWFEGLKAQRGAAAAGGLVAIADIPLLYETGHESHFDCVVVVACRPDQQIERLAGRNALSKEEAVQRIRSQMPIEEKTARADYVIDTSGSYEETNRQVADTWQKLRARLEART